MNTIRQKYQSSADLIVVGVEESYSKASRFVALQRDALDQVRRCVSDVESVLATQDRRAVGEDLRRDRTARRVEARDCVKEFTKQKNTFKYAA